LAARNSKKISHKHHFTQLRELLQRVKTNGKVGTANALLYVIFRLEHPFSFTHHCLTMITLNYYELLGVEANASNEQIAAAAKQILLRMHSDKHNGCTALDHLIQVSFPLLLTQTLPILERQSSKTNIARHKASKGVQ
jgi:hypothetical protein